MMNGLQTLDTWSDYFGNPRDGDLGLLNAIQVGLQFAPQFGGDVAGGGACRRPGQERVKAKESGLCSMWVIKGEPNGEDRMIAMSRDGVWTADSRLPVMGKVQSILETIPQ